MNKAQVVEDVEARWGYCYGGELRLDEDQQLRMLVVRMWEMVLLQRELTGVAKRPDTELEPPENLVVDALSIILSPELNGA